LHSPPPSSPSLGSISGRKTNERKDGRWTARAAACTGRVETRSLLQNLGGSGIYAWHACLSRLFLSRLKMRLGASPPSYAVKRTAALYSAYLYLYHHQHFLFRAVWWIVLAAPAGGGRLWVLQRRGGLLSGACQTCLAGGGCRYVYTTFRPTECAVRWRH